VALKKIYEDKLDQQSSSKYLHDLNTEEQITRGQFYIERYRTLKAEMEPIEEEHSNLERLYTCDRDVIDNAPNSFIPLIAPIIDGQMASITEQNLVSNVKGKRYSDQAYARDAQMCIDLILKENDVRSRLKTGVKRYSLFGWMAISVDYDPTAMDNFGLATIRFDPIHKVFVDGNIKDMADAQDAAYIIQEIGYKSIMWARNKYGDDIADFLAKNNSEAIFNADAKNDEQFSFMLLKVWHRNNKKGNLQLIEMDGNGFILEESSPDKPYFEWVENRYPIFFAGLYQEEGEFARFGDGKRLKFMQETLNKLWDEVIVAIQYSSQGKKFVDIEAGGCDPEEVADSDPSKPVICRDPQRNIYVLQGKGINPIVLQIINLLLSEAQRVARFSALMTGNGTGEKITATQAGIQQQQGNSSITDKKADISSVLAKACKYAMEICMEKWVTGLDTWEDDKKEKPYWLDVKKMTNVPVLVPPDKNFTDKWDKKQPDKPLPEFIQWIANEDIKDDTGNVIHKKGTQMSKKAEFDIEISIGEGLPTNKMALYNIIISLAQLQVIDETTGQPKPLLGYTQVKKMVEDLIGIPIDDAMEEAKQGLTNAGMPLPQQPKVGSVNMNANIPNANVSGNVGGGGGMV